MSFPAFVLRKTITFFMALFFFNHTVLLRLCANQTDSVHGPSLSLFRLHLLVSTLWLHSLACASSPRFSLSGLPPFFHYSSPPNTFQAARSLLYHKPHFMNLVKTCKNLSFIPPFINHYLIFFWFYSSSNLFLSRCTYLCGQLCLWLLCNHSCRYYVQFPLSGFAS